MGKEIKIKHILNSEVITEIAIWNRKVKKGFCFDSSNTFLLPDFKLIMSELIY